MSRTDLVGTELPGFSTHAEREQLQLFASIIGEENPIYFDVDVAVATGYPDLPIPPTFLFSMELKRPDKGAAVRLLGADQRQILHGEQKFKYHNLAFAGEKLDFAFSLTDYFEKKDGALKFLTRETRVTRNGVTIAQLLCTLVVRELELA